MAQNLLLEVAPYVLAVVALGILLFLHFDMRKAMSQFQARWTQRQQTLHAEVGTLRSALRDLKVRLAEAERCAESFAPPQVPKSGINISQRALAIRLFRRGDRAEQIAAVVGMNLNEVELLGRIHRINSAIPVDTSTARPMP